MKEEVNFSETVHYLDIVDSHDKKGLESFQYQGKDDSILYQYVFSPMCQWIVEHWLPTRFTPNLITLVGLQFVVIPHLLIIFTAWNDEDLPHWSLYLLNGIGTMLYSVLSPYLDFRQSGRQTGKIYQPSQSTGDDFRPRL